jgi:hypothetical protein
VPDPDQPDSNGDGVGDACYAANGNYTQLPTTWPSGTAAAFTCSKITVYASP